MGGWREARGAIKFKPGETAAGIIAEMRGHEPDRLVTLVNRMGTAWALEKDAHARQHRVVKSMVRYMWPHLGILLDQCAAEPVTPADASRVKRVFKPKARTRSRR